MTRDEAIAYIKSHPRPTERIECDVVPQGWCVTRVARDHYIFREGDVSFHIARAFPGCLWKGVSEWSDMDQVGT